MGFNSQRSITRHLLPEMNFRKLHCKCHCNPLVVYHYPINDGLLLLCSGIHCLVFVFIITTVTFSTTMEIRIWVLQICSRTLTNYAITFIPWWRLLHVWQYFTIQLNLLDCNIYDGIWIVICIVERMAILAKWRCSN